MEEILRNPGYYYIGKNIIDWLDPLSFLRCRLVSKDFKEFIDNHENKLLVCKIQIATKTLGRNFWMCRQTEKGYVIDFNATNKTEDDDRIMDQPVRKRRRIRITRNLDMMKNLTAEKYPEWQELLNFIDAIDVSTEKQDLTAILSHLLNSCYVEENETEPENEYGVIANPFKAAVIEGNESFVRYLIKSDLVRLHYQIFNAACSRGHLEILKLLLQCMPERMCTIEEIINANYGGSIREQIKTFNSCFNNIFLDRYGSEEPEKATTLFQSACLFGRTNIVEYLLYEFDQRKIDVDAKLCGLSPLDIACSMGHVELAKLLLNYEDTKLKRKEAAGQSGLDYACATGQIEIVKFLMEENIPLTLWLDGRTPLITACQNGEIELVAFMFQHSEKFDFSVKNQENLGPFEILVNYAKETGIKVKDKTKFLSIWSDLILPSNDPVLQNMWRFSQYTFRVRL